VTFYSVFFIFQLENKLKSQLSTMDITGRYKETPWAASQQKNDLNLCGGQTDSTPSFGKCWTRNPNDKHYANRKRFFLETTVFKKIRPTG